MHEIEEGFEVLLILVGLSTPVIVICVYLYLRKRLEHKQIMAAIEKGMSLPEIKTKPPKSPSQAWIINLTAGVAWLIASTGFVCITITHHGYRSEDLENSFWLLVAAAILFAIGVSRLLRGILQRQTEKAQSQNGTDKS